jgi:hypothetical protein
VLSVEYAAHDLLLAAEYSRWWAKLQSDMPAVYPESSSTSERMYALAAYRFGPRFVPGLYYSLLFPDVNQRSASSLSGFFAGPRATHQHDVAATLRFDINAYWLFKLEAHYMRGTAGLDPSLNGNTPLTALESNWAVFLAKTTVSF